ncbi:hypothetical protein BH10CHL1_BH10CHL1_50090 [soil metagenome]
MTTITTLILDITNECLAAPSGLPGAENGDQAVPTLTAQHRAAIIECAKLGHAYAITRTAADQAYAAYQLHLVQGLETWQTHIEQDQAATQLQIAFYEALSQRRKLFVQIKEQSKQA